MTAPVPVFVGCVKDGQVQLKHRDGFLKHARTFEGKDVEVTIRKQRSQRSHDQNAYWHAVPFPLFAEEWGVSIEAAKLLLLGECFGWCDVLGHTLPLKPHTSQLTTVEGAEFTEWMVQWGMTDWNMTIPLPSEVAA